MESITSYIQSKISERQESLYYLYFCYLHFSNNKKANDLIKKSNELYKYVDLYKFTDFEMGQILDEEFKKNQNSFNKTTLLNPSITFSEFLNKVGDNA